LSQFREVGFGGRRFGVFLADEEMLMELMEEMNGVLVDPLKTTTVQDYRLKGYNT
jgi:hypothetical protein